MSKQPQWWCERLQVLDGGLAVLAGCKAEDTNISIWDSGQGVEVRRLYGKGSVTIKGVSIAVFATYLLIKFENCEPWKAKMSPGGGLLSLMDARSPWRPLPVTSETLERIEETVCLTVADAREMMVIPHRHLNSSQAKMIAHSPLINESKWHSKAACMTPPICAQSLKCSTNC
jgi:hypothetical protein